jgi:hypothetical protein
MWTAAPFDALCELADRNGWRLEVSLIAGLLRLAARDETGAVLARPVPFDTADRDGSALRLLQRIPAR